jgi:hypothetical protein
VDEEEKHQGRPGGLLILRFNPKAAGYKPGGFFVRNFPLPLVFKGKGDIIIA